MNDHTTLRSRKSRGTPAEKLALLRELEKKVLWLSTWMIHNAIIRVPAVMAQGRRSQASSRRCALIPRSILTCCATDRSRSRTPRRSFMRCNTLGASNPRQARALPPSAAPRPTVAHQDAITCRLLTGSMDSGSATLFASLVRFCDA